MPEYLKLIKDTKAMKDMKKRLENGENFLIVDLDGPPLDLFPTGAEVTEEFLREMLNEPKYLFGHGYLVACELAGLGDEMLIMCEK